ncbi:MAG: Lnb N-terminal periplasmic domain-containing protein [Acidiferrobacteraceae bacterium]
MLSATVLHAPVAIARSGRNPYLDELIQRARRLDLAHRPGWLALGLYDRRFFGGYASESDDTRFFAAPDGEHHPGAELNATLAAFFKTKPGPGHRQSAQCRFIARYHWLDRKLHFDPRRLARQPCRRFHAWYRALAPRSIDVVFPAADVNNPSSMFGHLFLRVNSTRRNARNALLSYSVSYAADIAKGDPGVLFAYKGLFGGYPGTFTMSPYYAKVREYSSFDNRDIWVYPLRLTKSQMHQLLREVWELGPVRFPYYFFSRNCASQDLDLLVATHPQFKLLQPFHGWVIPSDAVRVLWRRGLLGPGRYRPSLRSRLKAQLHDLPASERALVKPVVAGLRPAGFRALAPQAQASVLDAAYAYLHYRSLRGDDAGRKSHRTVAERERALLLARSRRPDPAAQPKPRAPLPPQAGHESQRLLLGVGVRAGRGYQELAWRPAYHALLDPGGGYTPGAQIDFMDVRLRRDDATHRLFLERLRLVDIISLATRDRFFHPWSWRVNTGLSRREVAPGNDPLLFDVTGGGGVTYGRLRRAAVYGFIDGSAETAHALAPRYAAGAGAEVGVLARPYRHWHLRGFIRDIRFFAGDRHSEREIALEQSWAFGQNHALRLDILRRHEFSSSWNQYEISWSIFFF